MVGRYRDAVTETADGPLSLTRAEAEERFALLDVERYDVAVDLRGLFEGEVLEATSTATFRCHRPGASTFVDCTGEITHATLNGVDLDPATASGGRLPLPDLQADNVLVVSSRQSDTSSGHGIQRTVDASDKLVYLWTTFEPDHARRAFANFDQPDLKAVHALHHQRAGHLDGHQQLRAHGGRRAARRRSGLALRRHAAPLDVRHGVQRRPVLRDPRATRRPRPRSVLPPVAQAPPRPRRRRAVRADRAGPGVVRREVRRAVPPGEVRPGLRARHGRRDGELGLRDVRRRPALPQHAHPLRSG